MVSSSSHYTAIAGTGAVARTFGRFFVTTGERIVFISRSAERARNAAKEIGGAEHGTYENHPAGLSRVLIAVPDDAISSVAALLARAHPRIAIHTSGNLGAEALRPLSSRGTACGAMHPLQTLTGGAGDLAALRGAAFALAGDREAVLWAESIARGMGGEILEIPAERRAFYHAAAVMASNYVTALLDASEFLFGQAGVEPETARRIVGPLILKAVENTLARGAVAALTGPIARGDRDTVAAHLRALASAPESIQQLYRAAGAHTLDVAKRKGLAAEAALEIQALFQ